MFLIHGKKTATIKKYTDHNQSCTNCKAFDLNIKVFQDYYHVFFIPLYPVGIKSVNIKCNNCGQIIQSNSIEKHYENITRTPFYLYTIPLLFVIFILTIIILNLSYQKEKAKFVDNPKINDVYTVRKDENDTTIYYFLKVIRIKGDTVLALHNNLEYYNFISQLDKSDYFIKEDTLLYQKKELKRMLDKDEINSVDRDYGEDKGFNRVQ